MTRTARGRLARGLVIVVAWPAIAGAQGVAPTGPLQEAARLDVDGRTKEARAIIQQVIDSATAPLARAVAERSMAISYAFDADCTDAAKHEEAAIGYWATREAAEPQNAFYQEGELANEAARICIDAGDLDIAERWYRRGAQVGLREPEPRTHPKSLWDYRLAHALARLAARRGDAAAAATHVAEARAALDDDPKMAAQQDRFYPYLTGYVALYTGELERAESELTRALAMQGNADDPFMNVLLGMTYEKLGDAERARDIYEKAYNLATAHNPPSAFARPFTRHKLGIGG